MKHTKGPWYPVQYANCWNIQSGEHYGDPNILNEDSDPNAEANAIVAAAAPDLLEALQQVKDYCRKQGIFIASATIKKMDAAIEKATQ